MIQTSYNPDVLSCLANLSNDEVFTPPSLVNDMLDLLPAELWSNSNAKFLDPVSKSGVFLREMAKRLMNGLETQIPDKQARINHIFNRQLYGIAITDRSDLKTKLKKEGSELSEKIGQLKIQSADGKFYKTHLANERLDETQDPELSIDRALEFCK